MGRDKTERWLIAALVGVVIAQLVTVGFLIRAMF